MRRIARRRHHHYNRCAHIAVGPIAAAKLKVFDTCVAHSKRTRWVCVDTWTLDCLHDVSLVACILLVASCLVPAFQCWVLEGCWLMVARVLLAVLRQEGPPLRPELPACKSTVCVCVSFWGCVGLFAVVYRCCSCWRLCLLLLWLWFEVVAVFVGGGR